MPRGSQNPYIMKANPLKRGGNLASIQIFLIISTCFLYLVAAGLFSKSVWLFEMNKVNQLAIMGFQTY